MPVTNVFNASCFKSVDCAKNSADASVQSQDTATDTAMVPSSYWLVLGLREWSHCSPAVNSETEDFPSAGHL